MRSAQRSDHISDTVLRMKTNEILEQLSRVVVGKQLFLEKLLCVILAGGHALIEDLPGLAKTLTVRSLSELLGLSFKRIQFTPDLLPGDITGTHVFNGTTRSFDLIEGPIFAQLILADEINRASPKTQSALLEAMEESSVTLDGETKALESPFIVVATQNPIEHEGTYPLPEAQLDRFMARLSVGYPSRKEEVEILARHGKQRKGMQGLSRIISASELLSVRSAVEEVAVVAELLDYIASLSEATRSSQYAAVGASPRATIALLRVARARAFIDGRDFVLPDDVKFMAYEVLAHRIIVKPEMWSRGITAEEVAKSIVESTPVPK